MSDMSAKKQRTNGPTARPPVASESDECWKTWAERWASWDPNPTTKEQLLSAWDASKMGWRGPKLGVDGWGMLGQLAHCVH